MSKTKSVEFSYSGGVITLSSAMRRRLEKAAKAVNLAPDEFALRALDSTMQSAIESED